MLGLLWCFGLLIGHTTKWKHPRTRLSVDVSNHERVFCVLLRRVFDKTKRRAVVFEERRATIVASEVMPKAAQVFALPEILPEQTQIVLDVQARLALLLKLDG